MRILDRYLVRQFLQVLLICFCSLVGLYAVIDALGHLDQFSSHAASSDASVLATIGRFYLYQSVGFFDRTSGILAMMAAMFTMAWFKRHNELTAIMAAGIPQLRACMPVLIACAVIGMVAAGSRELVLPSIRGELLRNTNDLSGTAERSLHPAYDPATEIVLGGQATISRNRTIIKPFLLMPADLQGSAGQISAETGHYVAATEQHPAGYLLDGVPAETFVLHQSSLRLEGRIVLYTPHDAPWLQPNQLFLPSGVSFDQLAAGPRWRYFASTAELLRHVKHPSTDVPTEAYVTLHGRLVRPVLDMSLVVIGLPLILTRRGRSPFLAVGLAMALVAGFLLVALTSEFLGNSGWISPSLAAWLPLFIFVPLAVGNFQSLRR